MLAKCFVLNPKGPYVSFEKEKQNFCAVLTYSIKGRVKLGSFMSRSCNNGQEMYKKA